MNTNASSSQTNRWLNKAAKRLEQAGISTARLDCLVLLEDVTGKDRSKLLAHPETELTMDQTKRLDGMLKRREAHEPLAYIRGESEFYGREFIVNPHTLEPRPETETMIELLLDLVKSQKLKVKSLVDVGTGSGCIAITAKLEIPELQVFATDIDKKCLETAQENSQKFGADVKFLQGNLFEPLLTFDFRLSTSKLVILANLPYVPNRYELNEAAKYEPKHAIFGGGDGLDLYRQLFEQIAGLKHKPGYVLTESLPFQHAELAKIAGNYGYRLEKTDDFIQIFSN